MCSCELCSHPQSALLRCPVCEDEILGRCCDEECLAQAAPQHKQVCKPIRETKRVLREVEALVQQQLPVSLQPSAEAQTAATVAVTEQ
jgi:hypothetical protein